MKFDYIIGNPPYQEEAPGTSTSDKPIYHMFMDAVYDVADKVELITPARFLFDAGATPKVWNQKMLSDEHFKILQYFNNSKDVFSNVGIAGGVVISYRDRKRQYHPVTIFTSFKELSSIFEKVYSVSKNDKSLVSLIETQFKFNLDVLNEDCPGLNRTDRRLESNIFKLPVFHEDYLDGDIKIYGLDGMKRTIRFVNQKYIDTSIKNYGKYKVILPKSYGTGIAMGACSQIIGPPIMLLPYEGYTRTFIGVGSVETEQEAIAIFKYVKTKFCRTMLSVLKVTQDNNPEKWKYVPLQDFTSNSDIDWAASIPNIDHQLYRKYGLTQEEIDFIETHVKEMA